MIQDARSHEIKKCSNGIFNSKLHSGAAQTNKLYTPIGDELQINETDVKQIT
jgi:hypothetical protein